MACISCGTLFCWLACHLPHFCLGTLPFQSATYLARYSFGTRLIWVAYFLGRICFCSLLFWVASHLPIMSFGPIVFSRACLAPCFSVGSPCFSVWARLIYLPFVLGRFPFGPLLLWVPPRIRHLYLGSSLFVVADFLASNSFGRQLFWLACLFSSLHSDVALSHPLGRRAVQP